MSLPKTPLETLFKYAKHDKKHLYLAVSYSIINKILDVCPPLFIGAGVEVVVKRENSFLAKWGLTDVLQQLYLLGFLTILVFAFESLFEYLLSVKWRTFSQNIQHRLRMDTYNHMQQLETAFFEDHSTGELTSIVNDDINQLERFLDGGANNLVQVFTTVVVIGGIFIYVSPLIAAFCFVPIPIIFVGAHFFQKKLVPKYKLVRERVGQLSHFLVTNITGITTIKNYATEDYESERLKKHSLNYSEANTKAILFSAIFIPAIRMAIVIGFAATVVIGGYLVVQGALNAGEYSVLIFLTQRLLWPIARMGQDLDAYERAMSSVTRIFQILNQPIVIPEGLQKLAEPVQGEIEFRNVHFKYKNSSSHLLNNFNLKIKAKSVIAIVGYTGSGKTTILKLLSRFYDPQEGQILIDNQDIRNLTSQNLHSQMAVVSQEAFLFHGTVFENIIYGSFNKSRDEVIRASSWAEAHEFIMSLPQQYETIIGERGQKLSGGQKQRISMARAILKAAPILVLDEATSSVDNETELAIKKSLQMVSNNRTVIMVAHRLSTVRNADQIYVIDKGKLVRYGTHEQLLSDNKIYQNMWKIQTGEMVDL